MPIAPALRRGKPREFATETVECLRDLVSEALDQIDSSCDGTSTPSGLAVSLKVGRMRQPSLTSSRPFLQVLQTRLDAVVEKLRGNANLMEKKTRELLGVLERLAGWPQKFTDPSSYTRFDPKVYPLLFKITDERDLETQPWNRHEVKACIQKLSGSGPTGRGSHDRKNILLSLKAFAPITTPPRGSEAAQLKRKPASEPVAQKTATECLRELHGTLCRLAYCQEGNFRANVSMSFIPETAVSEEEIDLEIFISHSHPRDGKPYNYCREAQIHAYIQGSNIKYKDTGEKIDELCELIQEDDPARLRLLASQNGLFQERSLLRHRPTISLELPSVPLSELLQTRSMRDDKRRLLLSFLLAKAVWKFYDAEWMAEDWTRDAVHFMQQVSPKRPQLSPKPFIVSELKSSTAPDRPKKRTHPFPRILALGIVLLEIEVGGPVVKADQTFPTDGYRWANTVHTAAAEYILSDEWKRRRKSIPEPLADTIEKCIKPDLGGALDSENARRQLYTIVQDLGKLFSAMWQLDPERFTPEPMYVQGGGSFYKSVDEFCHSEESMASLGLCRQQSPPTDSAKSLSELGFEADMGGHTLHTAGLNQTIAPYPFKHSDNWIRDFKLLRHKFRLTRDLQRIKLAILDTGVQRSHPDFRDKAIIECLSFTDEDNVAAGQDYSGHGTHIAGIILDLTSNVDVYIARVVESPTTKSRTSIVNAILWAREEWKVDMISMSFGYQQVGGRDAVKIQIDKCLARNIVIFASASNDGANTPPTYPGKYDGVLCIYSATGLGHPSETNPTAEEGKNNFCVLGDGIESSWPQKGSEISRERQSGTSFATPVAVSIAAFAISYLRWQLSELEWNIEPLTPNGVRLIFEEMAKNNRRNGYDIVSPMFFFRMQQSEIRARLIKALGGYQLARKT